MGIRPTQNFESTLKQLEAFLKIPIQNDRDRAGIIQAFEFTFEQSWLALQKQIGSLGLRAASPKQAFTLAMAQGWIETSDELKWIKMIEDRNLTSHTYKQELANEVLGRIQNDYVELFKKLLFHLKNLNP